MSAYPRYNSPRNYCTTHTSDPHQHDVINDEDGTCHFKLDTIPDKGVRTITVHGRHGSLFSFSIGPHGVCYQMLDAGHDAGLFTLWDDEV